MVDFEQAIKIVEELGNGIHEIKHPYYAYGEPWYDSCIGEEWKDIELEYITSVMEKDIPMELREEGFEIIHMELVQDIDDTSPFGWTVALLRKNV